MPTGSSRAVAARVDVHARSRSRSLLLSAVFSRLQPVLVDVDEQGVLRWSAVAFPQVGLPEADLVERHLRKSVAAVGKALRVRERAEGLRDPAGLSLRVVRGTNVPL